jgi:nicotinamide-nucleotide amidase
MDLILQRLADALRMRGWMLATAESCTGGWIAKLCTDLAGSSVWFERGFVTYSNEAKQDMLGVNTATLAQYGAVSEPVVAEMAAGVLLHSRAQIALSVSGIAGPTGGTASKPVGTVCFGWAREGGEVHTETCHFTGDRDAVRLQSVEYALRGVERYYLSG